VQGRYLEKVLDRTFKKYKSSFDLSVVNLDGSHSSCIRGGEEVSLSRYERREKLPMLFT
jgi:hypothetical protein